MHILPHGFGQRRKSSHSRPRDLQIRKISFSGSSLSSGCSLSSSTSSTPVATPTARTPTTIRPDMDPLHLNPSFHAPPRLFDRPFKDTKAVPVFVDHEEEEESVIIEPEVDQHAENSITVSESQQEAPDYFYGALPMTRPSMPKSRWSDSTIQTLDIEINQDDDEEEEDEDEYTDSDEEDDVLTMRRLSRRAAALQTLSLNITYNRPGAPQRPPMRSLDSVDNYIRRGGWKRRGIVFRSEDVGGTPAERASF